MKDLYITVVGSDPEMYIQVQDENGRTLNESGPHDASMIPVHFWRMLLEYPLRTFLAGSRIFSGYLVYRE